MDWQNKLYFGGNLGIVREHVAAESVELTWFGPPFNSNATYDVPVRAMAGIGTALFPCRGFLGVCVGEEKKGPRQKDDGYALTAVQ